MYDFDAGDISLDFANTNNWHASAAPQDFLHNFMDLIQWGHQAGLVTSDQVNQLGLDAEQDPEKAAKAFAFAIQVRESIYRIFSNLYAGRPISEVDLSFLNSVACEAMAHLQLTALGGEYRWKFPPNLEATNLIVWTVARAASDLLTSSRVSRVRECEDDRGCGYLFIDQTKNHSRRWCSMESCGNRAKARRHYSRIQAG
jgi:predicted RNA-binding Zn ribbon-like protein